MAQKGSSKGTSKTPKKTGSAANKSTGAGTGGAAGVATINTTFAVQDAAALVGRKVSTSMGAPPKKESSTFKQLKEGMNQPTGQGMTNLLDKTGSPSAKRSALPFSQQSRQVGHNQTFGADVNRAGVPRRTGG